MRFLTVFLVLFTIATLASANLLNLPIDQNLKQSEQDAIQHVLNSAALSCGINSLDFSSLTSTTDYTGSNNGYNYFMNICGTVNNQMCTSTFTNSPVAVCQVQSGATSCQGNGGPFCYNLGNWDPANPPTWGLINPSNPSAGATLLYSNGDICWANGNVRTAKVNLQCGTTTSPTFTAVEGPVCYFTLTMQVNCNGGNGGGGGGGGGGNTTETTSKKLSGGWIFVIIFLVSAFLYFTVGFVYNTKSKGLSGMDAVPNISFWRELPGLVKDGCLFTYRKIRGCCGKGDVTYDQM